MTQLCQVGYIHVLGLRVDLEIRVCKKKEKTTIQMYAEQSKILAVAFSN